MRAYRAGQDVCRRWPRHGVAGYTRPAMYEKQSLFVRLSAFRRQSNYSNTRMRCLDVVFPVLYDAIYKPLYFFERYTTDAVSTSIRCYVLHIGVARIFSRGALFSSKKLTTFL